MPVQMREGSLHHELAGTAAPRRPSARRAPVGPRRSAFRGAQLTDGATTPTLRRARRLLRARPPPSARRPVQRDGGAPRASVAQRYRPSHAGADLRSARRADRQEHPRAGARRVRLGQRSMRRTPATAHAAWQGHRQGDPNGVIIRLDGIGSVAVSVSTTHRSVPFFQDARGKRGPPMRLSTRYEWSLHSTGSNSPRYPTAPELRRNLNPPTTSCAHRAT